jgi:peptide/nickel transport system ATP-binding protein
VILEVDNVTASYTGVDHVLEDIDLKIRRGRTVALVGESGSGKSTLARVITGLLPPAQGRVLFNGEELPPPSNQRNGRTCSGCR